ncbi:PucR family transcriptional regulator [Homoserinimonas sp. A447]
MPSVAEIIAIPALSLDAVALPRPDAQARWVATSELDDPSPFLEGGEILLTTGLVARDAAQWRRFVGQLLDAGVVALGFGVGLSHPDVPGGLRKAATELSLNLFSVPRPVPFIAVSRAVADLLWASERETDRQALQHQQELTGAAIGGPAELVATLARIVGGDAVLCTPDGTTIAGWPAAGLLERALPHIARMNAVGVRGAAVDIGRDSRVVVLPVGVGSQAEAYLAVETDSTAAGAQRAAVTTAVALLSLDRARARAELDADRRIRAGALSLALQSDTEAARSLLAGTAQSATLPRSRARVLRARGSSSALDRALTLLERDSAELGHPLAARTEPGSDTDQLIAIIQAGDEYVEAALRLLNGLEVGVGPARPLAALAQSDDGSRNALAAASAVRPVVVWTELARAGIDSLVDPGTLSAFAESLLDTVLTRADATELLDGLRAFLSHNGHVGPAADSLGIHRNTLRNRLATAEDLLSRSLHDPQLRSDLWVALKQVGGPSAGSWSLGGTAR